ncbi:MAG: ribosomal protein S18-alanine N-acetyltransferase [Promethearchaeota archaeon]
MRTIRPIKQTDFNQIMQIEFESFSDPYPLSLFRLIAENFTDLFLVAVQNGELLGYVVAEIEQQSDLRIGHLLSIAVRKDKRRMGIGDELLSSIIGVLVEKGCEEVYLEVRVSNDGAKAFYRKQGFKKFWRTRKYYNDGEDALVMRLPLEDRQ